MSSSFGPSGLCQVLYVEDRQVNVAVMRELFRLRPHLQLEVAENGLWATRMAPLLNPRLLLIDLRLPDCFGTELLPLLRLRFGWQNVPAIAVTADPVFDCLSSGFAEIWHKPLDIRHVLQRLDHWVPPEPALLAEAHAHDGELPGPARVGGRRLP
jgi:CheY-like chemotaxis protein